MYKSALALLALLSTQILAAPACWTGFAPVTINEAKQSKMLPVHFMFMNHGDDFNQLRIQNGDRALISGFDCYDPVKSSAKCDIVADGGSFKFTTSKDKKTAQVSGLAGWSVKIESALMPASIWVRESGKKITIDLKKESDADCSAAARNYYSSQSADDPSAGGAR